MKLEAHINYLYNLHLCYSPPKYVNMYEYVTKILVIFSHQATSKVEWLCGFICVTNDVQGGW